MKKLLIITTLFAGIVCITAGGIASFFQPGALIDFYASSEIKEQITSSSFLMQSLDDPITLSPTYNFLEVIRHSIPQNIFRSLTKNYTVQIVIFSVIFGLALVRVPQHEALEKNIESLLETFKKIFEWGLLSMPLLVFSSAAAAVSQIGSSLFYSLAPFVIYLFLAMGCLFLGFSFILKKAFQKPINFLFSGLKTTFIIAFFSTPLAATVPLLAFFKQINFSLKSLRVLVPVFLLINFFGTLFYLVFTSLVIAQVHGYNPSLSDTVLVCFFSIFSSLSNSGIEGESLVFLHAILKQIGIPVGPISHLLSTANFIIAPFLNVLSVQISVCLLGWLNYRVSSNKKS